MLLLMHLIVLSLSSRGDGWHLTVSQRPVLVASIATVIVAASHEVLPHFQDHVAVVLMMHTMLYIVYAIPYI